MGGHEMRIWISLAPASRNLLNTAAGGCPAHNGILDDHHLFAFDHVMDRIKFNTDPEFTQKLGGLDKGASDVMVADHPHFKRQVSIAGHSPRPRKCRNPGSP